MNPYVAYEAVNTKIITRKGRILDEKKLESIIDLNSVEQVTDFLSTKYNLKGIIENAKSSDLHRDDLETILSRFEVSEIERILPYFSGAYKDFMKALLMNAEISDLVMILRKIVKGEASAGIEKHFIHSESFSVLPYGKLSASGTVTQFIENLKSTPYYIFLKTVTEEDVVKREFHIEMKLQLLLYKTLLDKAEKLETRDKNAVKEILGLKIDFLNVQWIYRAKKYFDITPEEILVYSLQGGEKLSFTRLQKLCYSKSVDEFVLLARKYLRYDVFSIENEMDISKNIDNYLYDHVKKRKFEGNMGSILGYVLLLDIVVKDLITITEGIRYRIPKENLKNYLIRLK